MRASRRSLSEQLVFFWERAELSGERMTLNGMPVTPSRWLRRAALVSRSVVVFVARRSLLKAQNPSFPDVQDV